MSLVAAKTLQLVSLDKSTHKVVIVDEAWFLFSTPAGRALLNRLMRYARGFNATILLLTQLLEDLDLLRELVRTWFLFGHDAEDQIKLQLRMAGVEPTAARVRRQQNWQPGRCVMRDLRGRVAEIQVDLPTDELLRQLNTTPVHRGGPGMRRRLVLILLGALTAALVLVPVAVGATCTPTLDRAARRARRSIAIRSTTTCWTRTSAR